MLIRIARTGSFAVGWRHSHDHQCGNVGTNVLGFDVVIEADGDDLNPSGYIIDNLEIPRYFDTTYSAVKDFVSCETIAKRAVRDLHTLCVAEGARPSLVRVGVSGIEHSMISAETRF